jgi:hypothetical protein
MSFSRAQPGWESTRTSKYREFADTRMIHGIVPTVVSTSPVRTARTMTGNARQTEISVGKMLRSSFEVRGTSNRRKRQPLCSSLSCAALAHPSRTRK